MMDWLTSIVSFVDVVESKSFTKAAEKQYASSSAVSRRISWLENRLGVQLIARTTRTLRLTEEGAAFYENAKKLLLDFDNITQFAKVKRKGLSGVIHLSMPFSFTDFRGFNQVLKEFLAENPEIKLVLDYSNYLQDLISNNIDIALRSSQKPTPGYSYQEILRYQLGCYASPQYLAQHPPITKPEDLLNHNCMVQLLPFLSDWGFSTGRIQVKGNVKTSSPNALVQLAVQGVGIFRSSAVFLEPELQNGSLVPVLESYWAAPLVIYMHYRDTPTTPQRIKALVERLSSPNIYD